MEVSAVATREVQQSRARSRVADRDATQGDSLGASAPPVLGVGGVVRGRRGGQFGSVVVRGVGVVERPRRGRWLRRRRRLRPRLRWRPPFSGWSGLVTFQDPDGWAEHQPGDMHREGGTELVCGRRPEVADALGATESAEARRERQTASALAKQVDLKREAAERRERKSESDPK